MRRLLVTAMAVTLFAGGWPSTPAEAQLQPAGVVTVAPYETVSRALETIGTLADQPDLPQALEFMIAEATDGRGLAGLDQQRPLGGIFMVGEETFHVVGYVPVDDMAAFLETLEAASGGAVEDTGEGVYELEADAQTLVIREANGWALISDDREALGAARYDHL